jgi:tRNA (cmo5U34)-methyltransferase
MVDNASAHASADYEREVVSTIPFHAILLEQAVDVALAAVPAPRRWLDSGCGPGRLAGIALARAPGATFCLADPSAGMLALARAHNPTLAADRFFLAASHELPEVEPFDVITAVQCHHYYPDSSGREEAVRRCRALLRPGGALVVFENVRSETEEGHALQRRRWAAWQRGRGREEAVVDAQLAREGTRFFPIRPSDHQALLARAGFAPVELVWRAYGQAGFLAMVPPAPP